jgi:Glycosyl hydrolases family 16
MRFSRRGCLAGCIVAGTLGLTLTAGTAARASQPPPRGWQVSYSHNFATGGLAGWSVQPGSTAHVKTGADGVAITVTGQRQTTEVASNGTPFTPGSFVQARVYLPGAQGLIANFPALWAVSKFPSEIDMVEGLAGLACSHTHWNGHRSGAKGICGKQGEFIGWHTYSALWLNGQVKFWYDSTYLGELSMPFTTPMQLLFQNRSESTSCPVCYGPPLFPASDWLLWIKVWHEKAG